jgi:dihydroneopterin aldolase
MITVEVRELRLFGRHGIHAHEKEHGQEFVFDVALDVGARGAGDDIADAVDYREVAQLVAHVSDARSYDLLEALATAVADALRERFAPEALRVRVTKPEVKPGGLDATVSVTSSWP